VAEGHSEFCQGGRGLNYFRMGKCGEEQQQGNGSTSVEVEILRSKLELMETTLRNQAMEFKSELASAQTKIHADLKEQMDGLLLTVVKMQP
jgi:hypothetical protein